MDSGNSGSMPSSSGGDEEYDSRADTFSHFLNSSGGSSFGINSLSLPPPPVSLSSSSTPSLHNPPPTLFDHLPSFSHSPNPNPLYSPDPVWPDTAHRPNYQHNLGNLGEAPTSSPLLGPTSGPSPADQTINKKPTAARSAQPGSGVVKNSRKRTRASRRAPTTVLTTDTTNFRQMVQEFTGIPAPPFSAATSPSPYSRRLDLFSGGGPALGSLYPFRHPAQKAAPSFNIASTTPNSSAIATPTANNNSGNNIFSPNSYQLTNSVVNHLQNPLLSHQSLLFGSSKIQDNNPGFIEMGITQDHLNANISSFLNEGKERENNGENSLVFAANDHEGARNSWNYGSQDL